VPPEVAHTPRGMGVLKRFLYEACELLPEWTPTNVIERAVERIRHQVGDARAICALSGGVDSAVAALLVHKAIGKNLTCVFVDTGLLRAGEAEQVVQTFDDHFHVPLIHVDRSDLFLERLAGVIDPEEKRRASGALFIRVVGEVTRERLEAVRAADRIVQEEVRRAGGAGQLWQAFAVLLAAVRTVGVMGDGRTYQHPVVIRAVTSEDAMTADWARLPYDVLERMASRIIAEVPGVNRVVYDVSSKPPATIEWE